MIPHSFEGADIYSRNSGGPERYQKQAGLINATNFGVVARVRGRDDRKLGKYVVSRSSFILLKAQIYIHANQFDRNGIKSKPVK